MTTLDALTVLLAKYQAEDAAMPAQIISDLLRAAAKEAQARAHELEAAAWECDRTTAPEKRAENAAFYRNHAVQIREVGVRYRNMAHQAAPHMDCAGCAFEGEAN